jgi:hypothetical protein
MEHVDDFIVELELSLNEINRFKFICLFVDNCLKDYNYKPKSSTVLKLVIHEWEHKTNETILTINDMREILTTTIKQILNELNLQYTADAQMIVDKYATEYKVIKRKIKMIAYINSEITKGNIFKEFIDCYNRCYFS